jgi:hypothetical protein
MFNIHLIHLKIPFLLSIFYHNMSPPYYPFLFYIYKYKLKKYYTIQKKT